MDVAVVGAGRVGTALAVLLRRAGHRVVAASGREASRARVETFLPGVPFLSSSEAARGAGLVLIAVPDDDVGPVCEGLAQDGAVGRGQSVVHVSGSVPLGALDPARAAGSTVLAVHPLQTFADVESGIERLPGAHVAVTAWEEEGYRTGEHLARGVGASPFRLPDDRKQLYHAAAVFASNYLVAVEGIAERLFRTAGLEDPLPAFAPLAEATMANVLRVGPAAALTGPAARGDAGTVRRNLEALERDAPDAVAAYVVLAREALRLAAGTSRATDHGGVEEVLAEWS